MNRTLCAYITVGHRSVSEKAVCCWESLTHSLTWRTLTRQGHNTAWLWKFWVEVLFYSFFFYFKNTDKGQDSLCVILRVTSKNIYRFFKVFDSNQWELMFSSLKINTKVKNGKERRYLIHLYIMLFICMLCYLYKKSIVKKY